ncbi:MAG: sigma 54-interacting transcriptional regulator [Chitinophagaceae bacterium]
MKQKILIVEDQFVEADYLRLMLEQAGYGVTGIARSVTQAKDLIKKERPGFVLLDIFLKGNQTGIDLARQLTDENIPFVYLSANSGEDVLNAAKATQPYGFLVKPFREKDLLITLEIARYRHEHSQQSKNLRETGLLKQLKDVVNTSLSWPEKLLKIATFLQSFIPFDFMTVGFGNIGNAAFKGMCFLRIGFSEYQTIGIKELEIITGKTREELTALQSTNPKDTNATFYVESAFRDICKHAPLIQLFADTFQLRSQFGMPVSILHGKPFSFCLYSRRPDAYNTEHVALFERIRFDLADSIEKMLQTENEKITDKPRTGTTTDSTKEITATERFSGIIGKSHQLLNVFDQITQVAGTDTSVLLLGESGTGKEKIADAIHNLSNRKGKSFVKINCAALPSTLIESELFGHEKGAFTGAIEKKIGRFEKANGGTIFLDEVGEMPVELQIKLLRVLQEREIDRVGSNQTIKIDVRVIAATNKNLEKEVAEGRFRLDLYYRLNVFPVTLPPLRERREDIPALAYYFMRLYNQKAGRKISEIADDVLNRMMAYHWPGNIRELEHLMERSVLLAKGNIIEDILLTMVPGNVAATESDESRMKTIHENERDYILSVLKKCNGRIWGPGAAAEILNIHPSTLKSKMKKLGIRKEYIR